MKILLKHLSSKQAAQSASRGFSTTKTKKSPKATNELYIFFPFLIPYLLLEKW